MKKLPQETSELPNPRSFYLNPLPPQGFAHKEPKETLLKRAIGGEGEPAKSTQRTNQIPIPTRFAILTSGRFPRRSESRTPNLTLPQTCKERTRGNRHHQTARKIATKPNLPKILQEAAELLTISSAPPRSAPVRSPRRLLPTIQPRFGWNFWVDFLGFVRAWWCYATAYVSKWFWGRATRRRRRGF